MSMFGSRVGGIFDRISPRSGRGMAFALALLLCALAPAASAQSKDDCLACHSDPTLKGTRGRQSISVYLDEKKFTRSIHGQLDCVMCHQDLSGAEFPHKEDVGRVDCSSCHDKEATEYKRNIHGIQAAKGDKLAPGCTDCHGVHDILPRTDPRSPVATMNVPILCGRCHHEGTPVSLQHDIPQDRILENYSMSNHGEGLFKKGLTVTAVCTSCHTAHDVLPHTDPRSSINRSNIPKTCMKCHGRIEDVHRKVIEGRLWEEAPNRIPVCVDCHSPHKIRNVFYPEGMANKDCLTCHARKDLAMTRDGKSISLFVDEDHYGSSSHAKVACAQCHNQASPSHVRACETIQGKKVDCAICHAEVVNVYKTSIHGVLAAKNDPDAPRCLDCHSAHATQSKKLPSSPTFPRNVPELCGRCHRVGQKAAIRIKDDMPNPVESYRESIHGKGLLDSGLVVTATCADCHTPHGELPPADPRSTVNPARLADTCGRCHSGIELIFKASIHWPGNAKPGQKLPTCESCHSSHQIKRTDRTDFRFYMMDQCGNCHKEQGETFFDTYHGKVSRLGSAVAAKCYDCHGTHDILPADNPRSHLSRANLVTTCAQCHKSAHRQFAGYLTHATHHDSKKYPWLFYSFWGMTFLLIGTLIFALLHTFAWLFRLWRTRHLWGASNVHREGAKLYRRFTRFQRMLHLTMLLSFFTLALTGMTLKFSYTAWAVVMSKVLGGFDTMGALHRIAAICLGVVGLMHAYDIRRHWKDSGLPFFRFVYNRDTILFKWNDAKELFQSIRWFVGLGPRPHYGRYTYWEKFDYFAVAWGLVVIGSTGLVLWFPEIFTRILPGWSVNVATIVHSDEALLAVGFIFTIHFFNTHFRPDKFPMDPVIFTGRVPLEELKYDKPREYEEMVAKGTLDDYIVEPIPSNTERGFRIFGFIALGIGLGLIGLIIYAMTFGYR